MKNELTAIHALFWLMLMTAFMGCRSGTKSPSDGGILGSATAPEVATQLDDVPAPLQAVLQCFRVALPFDAQCKAFRQWSDPSAKPPVANVDSVLIPLLAHPSLPVRWLAANGLRRWGAVYRTEPDLARKVWGSVMETPTHSDVPLSSEHGELLASLDYERTGLVTRLTCAFSTQCDAGLQGYPGADLDFQKSFLPALYRPDRHDSHAVRQFVLERAGYHPDSYAAEFANRALLDVWGLIVPERDGNWIRDTCDFFDRELDEPDWLGIWVMDAMARGCPMPYARRLLDWIAAHATPPRSYIYEGGLAWWSGWFPGPLEWLCRKGALPASDRHRAAAVARVLVLAVPPSLVKKSRESREADIVKALVAYARCAPDFNRVAKQLGPSGAALVARARGQLRE